MMKTIQNPAVGELPPVGAGIDRKSSNLNQLLLSLKSIPVLLAFIVLASVVVLAAFAPVLGTIDPIAINPGSRFSPISEAHWLGSDAYGRDLYSRLL